MTTATLVNKGFELVAAIDVTEALRSIATDKFAHY
jgi:hypothetical protein